MRKPGSLIIRMRERSLRKVQVDDGFVLMKRLNAVFALDGLMVVEKRGSEARRQEG